MSWSLSSWQAARKPFELELYGRWYRARPVSAERVLAYQAALRGASEAQGWAETLKLLRDAFPWRPSYWWRGDPVKLFARVIKDSPAAAAEALRAFFPLLQGAPSVPLTNGTSLPP